MSGANLFGMSYLMSTRMVHSALQSERIENSRQVFKKDTQYFTLQPTLSNGTFEFYHFCAFKQKSGILRGSETFVNLGHPHLGVKFPVIALYPDRSPELKMYAGAHICTHTCLNTRTHTHTYQSLDCRCWCGIKNLFV